MEVALRTERGTSGPLLKNATYHFRNYENVFVGSEVVAWAVESGRANDEASAVELITEMLFDNGKCHHVHDEHDFKNEYLFYRFFDDESDAYRASMAPYSDDNNGIYRGAVSLRFDDQKRSAIDIRRWFPSFGSGDKKKSSSHWIDAHAVLVGASDESTSGSLIRFYRSRHAGVPFAEIRVQDCACLFSECISCKEGSYCITIRGEKLKLRRGPATADGSPSSAESLRKNLDSYSSVGMVTFTMCTKKSVDQSAWIEQLHNSGMRFEREEISDEALKAPNFYFLGADDLDTGARIPFSEYMGKVALVVNVASY